MNNKNFVIKVEQKENIFEFSNSKYEIYHKSENLEKGFSEFKEMIHKKIKFFNENNISIEKENMTKTLETNTKLNFKDIIIKNSIRFFFTMLSFFIIMLVIVSLSSSLIKKNEIKGGRQFWKNFENELEKFSKKEIDVKSQEKILNSIKRLGEKYKPFLEEIRAITD